MFYLIQICVVAFITVMVLLSFLAVVIELLTRVFPARKAEGHVDTVLVASIQSAVAARFPGAQVTNIKEVK